MSRRSRYCFHSFGKILQAQELNRFRKKSGNLMLQCKQTVGSTSLIFLRDTATEYSQRTYIFL